MNPKFEATARIKFECEDTDGTTVNMELKGSCDIGIFEQKFKASAESSIKQDDMELFKSEASLETMTGVNGDKIDAKIDSAIFRTRDENEDAELKFITASAQAKYGVDENGIDEMIKLGVNLVEVEVNGVKSRVGLNLDTGVSIDKNGVEAKFEGFGVKMGKEIGISTPIGEVSVDLGKLFGS